MEFNDHVTMETDDKFAFLLRQQAIYSSAVNFGKGRQQRQGPGLPQVLPE